LRLHKEQGTRKGGSLTISKKKRACVAGIKPEKGNNIGTPYRGEGKVGVRSLSSLNMRPKNVSANRRINIPNVSRPEGGKSQHKLKIRKKKEMISLESGQLERKVCGNGGVRP